MADLGFLSFDSNETVGGLVLGNTPMAPGNYTAATHPEYSSGIGVLTAAVPEPSTFAALFSGAAGLLALSRRRR